MVSFSELYKIAEAATEFSMASGDLSHLEIRDAARGTDFYYFYDTHERRLITDFVLHEGPRVALLCQVTLVRKGDRYSPRIRLWRKDKTKVKKALEVDVPDTPTTKIIKATVDTDDGHENFWSLITYLQGLTEIDVPKEAFRLVAGDAAQLVELLSSQDKPVLLEAMQQVVGGSLTDKDISILANRKAQVEYFGRLLDDEGFFAAECANHGKKPEAMWQRFFEQNSWIFGYGLSLITYEALAAGKLESITAGANVFTGAGKRTDALMRARAVISTLLLCEIKRHDTPLLKSQPYRPPDVYVPSDEVVGGTAQLQKTVRKAMATFTDQVRALVAPDGTPTGVDFSTTQPRQVLVVGSLNQFLTEHGVNGEMMETFELFRTSLTNVEVLTFDELYERSRFIVGD